MLISKAGSGHRRLSQMQKTREILSPEGEIAHLSEDQRRRLLQEETIVVEFEPERAKRSLPTLLRSAADRRRAHALLAWTEAPAGTRGAPARTRTELRLLLPVTARGSVDIPAMAVPKRKVKRTPARGPRRAIMSGARTRPGCRLACRSR